MAGNRLRNGLISLQRVLQGLNWRVAPVLALLLYLLLSQTRKVRSSGSVDVRLEHERRYSGFTGMDTFRSIEGRPYDMLYNTAVERPPNGSTAPLRDIIAVLLQRVEREPACAFVRMVHSALVDSPADVVLFHGSYPLRSDLHAIRAASPRRVDFVNVDGVFERYSADIRAVDPYLTDPTFVKRSKWAYYNMIRFWFYDVFCVPMVASGVRYVLRLDDDSYFPRAPLGGADLFAQMSQRGAVYLWNEVQVDLPHVVLGLQNFTTAYVREHALEPRSGRPVAELFPRGSCYMYFNNFEVSSVVFFRSAPVRRWSEAVLLSGGLHRHRWGDAPLRYITMVSPSIHHNHTLAHLRRAAAGLVRRPRGGASSAGAGGRLLPRSRLRLALAEEDGLPAPLVGQGGRRARGVEEVEEVSILCLCINLHCTAISKECTFSSRLWKPCK